MEERLDVLTLAHSRVLRRTKPLVRGLRRIRHVGEHQDAVNEVRVRAAERLAEARVGLRDVDASVRQCLAREVEQFLDVLARREFRQFLLPLAVGHLLGKELVERVLELALQRSLAVLGDDFRTPRGVVDRLAAHGLGVQPLHVRGLDDNCPVRVKREVPDFRPLRQLDAERAVRHLVERHPVARNQFRQRSLDAIGRHVLRGVEFLRDRESTACPRAEVCPRLLDLERRLFEKPRRVLSELLSDSVAQSLARLPVRVRVVVEELCDRLRRRGVADLLRNLPLRERHAGLGDLLHLALARPNPPLPVLRRGVCPASKSEKRGRVRDLQRLGNRRALPVAHVVPHVGLVVGVLRLHVGDCLAVVRNRLRLLQREHEHRVLDPRLAARFPRPLEDNVPRQRLHRVLSAGNERAADNFLHFRVKGLCLGAESLDGVCRESPVALIEVKGASHQQPLDDALRRRELLVPLELFEAPVVGLHQVRALALPLRGVVEVRRARNLRHELGDLLRHTLVGVEVLEHPSRELVALRDVLRANPRHSRIALLHRADEVLDAGSPHRLQRISHLRLFRRHSPDGEPLAERRDLRHERVDSRPDFTDYERDILDLARHPADLDCHVSRLLQTLAEVADRHQPAADSLRACAEQTAHRLDVQVELQRTARNRVVVEITVCVCVRHRLVEVLALQHPLRLVRSLMFGAPFRRVVRRVLVDSDRLSCPRRRLRDKVNNPTVNGIERPCVSPARVLPARVGTHAVVDEAERLHRRLDGFFVAALIEVVHHHGERALAVAEQRHKPVGRRLRVAARHCRE